MIQITLILLLTFTFNAAFAGVVDCKNIHLESKQKINGVKKACHRNDTYFSENCYDHGNCLIISELQKKLKSAFPIRVVTEVGSPTYNLCYQLSGQPYEVQFSSDQRNEKRLICVAADGSFMEAEAILEIFYALKK